MKLPKFFLNEFLKMFSFTESALHYGDLDGKNRKNKTWKIQIEYFFDFLRAGRVQLVIVRGDLINSELWSIVVSLSKKGERIFQVFVKSTKNQ